MIIERGRPFNVRKPSTDHWYNVSIGKSGVGISMTLLNKENKIGIELYIRDDKALFDKIYEHHKEIEQQMNLIPDWQRLDHRKASRIVYKIDGLNFNDHSNYRSLMNKVIDYVLLFRKVFTIYI